MYNITKNGKLLTVSEKCLNNNSAVLVNCRSIETVGRRLVNNLTRNTYQCINAFSKKKGSFCCNVFITPNNALQFFNCFYSVSVQYIFEI